MRDKSITVDTDCEIQNVEDEDSNDNDALVIDSKDDGLEDPEAIEDASLVDEGKNYMRFDAFEIFIDTICLRLSNFRFQA